MKQIIFLILCLFFVTCLNTNIEKPQTGIRAIHIGLPVDSLLIIMPDPKVPLTMPSNVTWYVYPDLLVEVNHDTVIGIRSNILNYDSLLQSVYQVQNSALFAPWSTPDSFFER